MKPRTLTDEYEPLTKEGLEFRLALLDAVPEGHYAAINTDELVKVYRMALKQIERAGS